MMSCCPRALCAVSLAGLLAVASYTIANHALAQDKGAEPAPLPKELRLSGIPDADKDKLAKQFGPVCDYLSKELGIKVSYEHVTDYNAAVVSLAANRIDISWLGGVTAVQAEERTKGQAVFVACRDTDLEFKSYFVANKDAIAAGRVKKVEKLEELKAMLAKCSFTFGDKSSTSGHIMPRHFLSLAGIDPEQDISGGPKFQLQGGHSATLKAVSSGQVDVGVLNYTNWDKADDATKQAAPIIYTTPPYVDYCMVVHKRLGNELTDKLRTAFTKLDAANPEHAKVLEAFSAKKFVAADPAKWDGIREILRLLKERKVLD
ncbi:MAG: phosphate/phosphite/phosphonate ABC transporter substrate-binding protein [Planctomycetota bacterium]